MNLQRILMLGTFSIVVVGGSSPSARSGDHQCHAVRAKIAVVSTTENCTSPIAFCSGTVGSGGILNGTFRGTVLGLGSSAGLPTLVPASTLSFFADHRIETDRGTLTMTGTGIFDTARGQFAEVDPINGGTGIFAGASGVLWLIGTSPDAGASFSGNVTGEVCLAR